MANAAHRFDNAKRRRPEHHARQAMLTPAYVLDPIRELLGGIGLDPCTEPDNPTGAESFYFLPDDGCSMPWVSKNVFCNPPYGEARGRWVRRCIEVGSSIPVVLLIPAHTETRTFQEAARACTSMVLVRARIRFGVLRENRRQEAASHGSAIIGFGIDLSPLHALGVVVQPQQPSRDWPEDAVDQDNGRYQCKCCHCGSTFIGHKRRVTCRACTHEGKFKQVGEQPQQPKEEP